MFVTAVTAIEIVIGALTLAVGAVKYRKKLSALWLLSSGALLVFAMVVAIGASGLLPPLRDTVTLTALGEKSDSAASEELCLADCTVDGAVLRADTNIPIREGKWFWMAGGGYGWRPETDIRQPEGVTRQVTVAVPVGRERALDFAAGPERGLVEVDDGVTIMTVDTYAPEAGTVSVPIAASGSGKLLLDKAQRVALFGAVFALLGAAIFFAVRDPERFRAYREKHAGQIAFFLIAACQFLVAFRYCGIDCLWYDELFEIGWGVQTDSLFARAFVDLVPRPISEFILGFWTTYAPYGEKWLMLLPELCTAAGIYFVGMCGKVYKNARAGVAAALFAACSGFLLRQCSYEIRSYSLFYMTGAIVLYYFLKRYRTPEQYTRGDKIKFTVAMVVFSQTHYYAYVICAVFFALEFIAQVFLKIKKIGFMPYIVTGICTIPSAVMVLRSHFISEYTSVWQPVPTVSTVLSLFSDMAGWSRIQEAVFFFGAVCGLAAVIWLLRKRERTEAFCRAVPLVLIGGVVVMFYIYGNFIRPDATLWSNRYFCGLFPCFSVVCGYGIDVLCQLAGQWTKRPRAAAACVYVLVCLAVVIFSGKGVISAAHSVRQPYRAASDWLYSHDDIYNDSTLILASDPPDALAGLNDYYFTKRGRRDQVNVKSCYEITDEELLQYDKVYTIALHELLRPGPTETLVAHFRQTEMGEDYNVLAFERR